MFIKLLGCSSIGVGEREGGRGALPHRAAQVEDVRAVGVHQGAGLQDLVD